MMDMPPAPKCMMEMKLPKQPDFLEQALGAMKTDQTLRRMKLKHGGELLKGNPRQPRGMATHKGNIY